MFWALLKKYGLAFVSSMASVTPDLRVLPAASRTQALLLLFPNITEDDGKVLYNCIRLLSRRNMLVPGPAEKVHVLSPPSDSCCFCHSPLVSHNNPVKVDCFNIEGKFPAVKVSLRCNHCIIFYGYSKYGNPQVGWRLYVNERNAVEVSDVCFVDRFLLMRWQISLA